MNERLNKYFNSLFEDAPDTQEMNDLREEIYCNTLDRYNDLISQGKSEDASFTQAVAGIGDIESLIGKNAFNASSKTPSYYSKDEIKVNKLKCNMTTALAVLLYILSIVPPIATSDSVGAGFMFIFLAAASAVMVFSYKCRINEKKFSGKIERLKEDNNGDYTKEEFEKARLRTSILLSLSVFFYIFSVVPAVISLFSNFSFSLMFICIAIATSFLVLYNYMKVEVNPVDTTTVVEAFKEWRKADDKSKELLKTIDLIILVIALIVYFIISFGTGAWQLTWVVFVIAAVAFQIVKLAFKLESIQRKKK